MRLVIKIRAFNTDFVSANYNYALSSAIYKLLRLGSGEFADFLHNKGFKVDKKPYKLFTFALQFDEFEIINNLIKLNEPSARLYISSPMIGDFIQNFLIGTFNEQRIEIFADNIKSYFHISHAEIIPEQKFYDRMDFNLLSPLVISTIAEHNGKLVPHYFTNDDDIKEINRVLNKNLSNKYYLINKEEYKGTGVKLKWDEKFIEEAKKSNKRLTKKISITKELGNPINIIGLKIPFSLEGDPELMHTGYECGFGEKNSMGFGLTEILNR
jgi:CRISPR-associated endoribonuclease Cas6